MRIGKKIESCKVDWIKESGEIKVPSMEAIKDCSVCHKSADSLGEGNPKCVFLKLCTKDNFTCRFFLRDICFVKQSLFEF